MKIRIKRDLFTEAVMIVFSVLLALFLSEWISAVKQKSESKQVLKLVHKELTQNLQVLEEWTDRHQKIGGRLREVLASDSLQKLVFSDHGFSSEAVFGTQIYQSSPSNTTWEMASRGNYMQHWPVETLFALSELYKIQETGVMGTINRVVDGLYDARYQNNIRPKVRVGFFLSEFIQVYNQELYLIRRYKETIALVEKDMDL